MSDDSIYISAKVTKVTPRAIRVDYKISAPSNPTVIWFPKSQIIQPDPDTFTVGMTTDMEITAFIAKQKGLL